MYIEGIILGSFVALAILAYRCFFFVNEGDCALLTSFGRPLERVYEAGPHFRFPWYKIHSVSLRERLSPVSRDTADALLARDGTPLRIDATLRYRIQPEHLKLYLFGLEESAKHLDYYYRSILRTT
ncbi:MAG: SPFH domain-containing protein, partial [Methylococcales bacterium]